MSASLEPRIALSFLSVLGCLTGGMTLSVYAEPAAEPASDTERVAVSLDESARRPAVAYVAHRVLRASLVDKNEDAWMEVRTEYEPGRGLSYTVLAEGGSSRIRQRALKAVLDKEVEASRTKDSEGAAFSSANYRYESSRASGSEVAINLVPLRRDARLIDGTAVVTAGSGELKSVEGVLAKNPSFWVRDVKVNRRYERVGGASLPVEITSSAQVRMFGSAHLEMTFRYLSVGGRPVNHETAVMTTASRDLGMPSPARALASRGSQP